MSDYFELQAGNTGHLFARDGHLTMLTLDRFDEGELSLSECDVVIDHLRACACCSSRHDEMHADVRLAPPPGIAARRRPKIIRTLAIGATLAAAASLLLIAWPEPEQASREPEPDGLLSVSPYTTSTEIEGNAAARELGFQLRARTDYGYLQHGDVVGESDAVAIELSTRTTGYAAVLVAGEASDDGGADGTGGIDPAPDFRVLQGPRAMTDGTTVRVSYTADDEANEMRVLAVMCTEPFSLAPDANAIDLENPVGCVTEEFHLRVYRAAAAAS